MRSLVLIVALLALLAAACDHTAGSGSTAASTRPAALVVSRTTARVCRQAAQTTPTIVVQCPTWVPRPARRLTTSYPHLYRLRGTVATTADQRWYDFWLTYGAPSGERHQTYGPTRFLHLELAAGDSRLVGRQMGLAGSTRLARIRLGGHDGILYHQQPYPRGGQWSDHYSFQWHQDKSDYYASVHSWGSQEAATALLARIISGLRPVNQITTQAPD